MTSMSRVMTVTRVAWHPREHARTLGAQPRLVHEGGGVHGPVQELLVQQDAVDALHCGSTRSRLFGPESAVFIIVFHPSSVLVTVRAKKKNPNFSGQEIIMVVVP